MDVFKPPRGHHRPGREARPRVIEKASEQAVKKVRAKASNKVSKSASGQ
ncbi:hypothetical protein ACMA1D_21415 [Streptomyces sp. 796.1]